MLETIVYIHLFYNAISKMGEYFASVVGRPNTVDDDILIKSITKLAITGSLTDLRRRTEVMNTCQTLDDFTEKL